jgi:hypothetical protein
VGNLACGVWQDDEGAIVIVVENAISPTVEEWNAYCAKVEATLHRTKPRGIALTDGGGPNAAQRNQINELLAGREAPSAVVTDSLMVRGIVTALSWFNKQTAAFSPLAITKALRHVDVRGERARQLWQMIVELDATLHPRSHTVATAARYVDF